MIHLIIFLVYCQQTFWIFSSTHYSILFSLRRLLSTPSMNFTVYPPALHKIYSGKTQIPVLSLSFAFWYNKSVAYTTIRSSIFHCRIVRWCVRSLLRKIGLYDRINKNIRGTNRNLTEKTQGEYDLLTFLLFV